jgi:hypothetical protein
MDNAQRSPNLTGANDDALDALMVFSVADDSMTQPTGDSFPEGARLYVDDGVSLRSIRDGEYAVFYAVDGADNARDYFGRFDAQNKRLSFLNPAHPPLDLKGLRFVGRAVESVASIWRRGE